MTSSNAAPKRSGQACSRCRQQKMKCSGDPGPCERCARLGRECIFEPVCDTTSARLRHHQQQPLTPSDGPHSLDTLDHQHRSTSATRKRSLEAARMRGSWQGGRPRRPPPLSHGDLLPTVANPYSSVQELEICPQAWTGTGRHNASSNQHRGTSASSASLHRARHDDSTSSLLECLAEADIAVADAQELFLLFGERLSPFIPSFYATDFNSLPGEPVFALAAIYAVARYLPGSAALRGRVRSILRRLIFELLMYPAPEQSRTTAEKMQGLVIMYACCEATGPDLNEGQSLDMLTLKGITEAYAVKLKIGTGNSVDKDIFRSLSLVWVVWLYTMSHHCAIIHGCPRTLSATTELLRAKATLEQAIDHPRIRLLLGECELCLLWEKTCSIPESSPEIIYDALGQWQIEWQDFLIGGPANEYRVNIAGAAGRQLYFHFYFTRFHLLTHLVDESGELYVAVGESLDTAHDFLQWITSLSPISRDRLRYLCDFGFVLMAYVCLYVLRALRNGVVRPRCKPDFLILVHEVAALMQSFGARADTRPIVYGCALEVMCKQYQSTQVDAQSPGLGVNLQDAGDALNLSQPAEANLGLAMATDPLVDSHQSRLFPDFWTLDPDLSVFDGMMAGIPVPEES
ncbi:putative transcriptional regulatory protein PB1A11,04c [Talaromyces islandicus]|uniref:Putative transcriptional regulatory protein PB1A11,04c n=1 Tax=Talaromyces islandicus TaxID=28573 RepID=A0A0U1M7J1_TALIS|nr:putative transcriptional regulatory protein PB1A11,04c [Talaromyces islandicus]